MDKPHIHVLLVEDNPADVLMLEAALAHVTQVAFHVTAVEQLGQGLQSLAQRAFDVVLLDLGLPDSQGLATFTRLHAQAPSIPVVVLSGLQDEELATKVVYAGAQDYLIKGQVGSELLVRSIRYAIERHRLQGQLRAREQHFRALIEHSADGIATIDAQGCILYESPAALHMLGYAPDERTGQSALALLHPDDLAVSTAMFRQIQRQPHEPISSELRYQRKDGAWCWLEATATNLLDASGVQAIVVNYRDVTARKQAEAALRQMNETLELRIAERTADLRQANAELARAARLKDEFLANMSHELRTPLNAILGRAELLREAIYGPLIPKQVEALQTMEASGRHLLALINEILDLAKIEAGKLQLQFDLVAVESVCQLSLQMVAESALGKRIAIRTTRDPQVTTISADERRLKQILINLLSNAVKFTPAGGTVGLEVHGDQAQQRVTFTVWDTGIGIAEADLPRLFQPFTQLDGGLNRQYGGTGLGLTLVYRLTQAHQGSVTVTSTPGQGSRFSVSLPWYTTLAEALAVAGEAPVLAPAGAADAIASSPIRPLATITQAESAPPPILLVEDNPEQIEVVVDYLQASGYHVSVAKNGAEALSQAREQRPALVLMDIQLPEMDGLTTMRCIRADAQLQAVPIIALTALALPGDRERCLAAGANAYLTKPVSLRALGAMIETHLIRR